MKKVTIIVPVYNVEQYIEKCLISLINQTFEDIEILAISDGSPDNSSKIIKKYVRKDERIKYIEKENGGYGSVIECGLKEVKTPYFMICDPDDWIKENAVEILVNTIEKNSVDLVVGCKYLVYNDNNEELYSNSRIQNVDIDIEYGKRYEDLKDFYYLDPSPHAKLYKTKLCKDIVLPHKVSFTDLLLYVYALEHSSSAIFLPDPLAYYLVDRPGNSVSTYKDKMFYDHYVIMRELLSYVGIRNNSALYSRVYVQFRYATNELKTNGLDSARTKYFNEYWNIYKELVKHNKEVVASFPKRSLISKAKCYMWVSGVLEKTMLKKLMGEQS